MSAAFAVEAHGFTAFGGARCEVISGHAGMAAVSAAVADVYAFEAALTRFDPRSELSRFNAAAGASWVEVSPLLEALLRAALDAYDLTDGLVNAAGLAALMAAGYDVSIERVRARAAAAPATPASVRPLPALPEVLEVRPGCARLVPGCGIDLGGVGKGWLADALCERLEDAVVNLGGDLRAIGEGPDGGGWTIELCDRSRVRTRDAGCATSGTAGRRWAGGHHLIDPRSGAPAVTEVEAVSVVARTALDAECLAKAAVIAGADGAQAWAASRGAVRVVVITQADEAR